MRIKILWALVVIFLIGLVYIPKLIGVSFGQSLGLFFIAFYETIGILFLSVTITFWLSGGAK